VKLLNNQLTKPEILTQRIALIVVTILLAILVGVLTIRIVEHSQPYMKEVLTLKGNPEQGSAIFQINCAGCHGWQADGLVGPSLQGVSKHKSNYGLIHQVISGETPPMPKFKPNTQEMADILSYLEKL